MRLESILFGDSAEYERMASVLRVSAAEHSPATTLTIHEITDTDEDIEQIARPGCKRTYIANARKAKHQTRIICEAKDGEVLGMLDADTMILGDLSEVADMEFDIAYTVRPHVPGARSQWKINTGVYFVRVSKLAKGLCREWYWTMVMLLGDKRLHDFWRIDKGYGGTHQAALGYMLEKKIQGAKILPLPCETYNAVPSCLEQSPAAKVVHIMSSVRQCCLEPEKRKPSGPNEQRIVERWQKYDARCLTPV